MTRVAVIGANGRMGCELIDAIENHDDLELGAALIRLDHPDVGRAVPGSQLAYRDDLNDALGDVDVAIDFASPNDLNGRASACALTHTPWLLGTTGLTAHQEAAVVGTSQSAPVLFSANTSLAMNGCYATVRDLAAVLGHEYDVDILDLHHRHKKDAPSGTALELGRAIASGWGRSLREVRVDSDTKGQREQPSIAFCAVRAGTHAGEHRVIFSGPSDSIEITHRAAHRRVFVEGALRAAQWLSGCEAGLYDMADYLDTLRDA